MKKTFTQICELFDQFSKGWRKATKLPELVPAKYHLNLKNFSNSSEKSHLKHRNNVSIPSTPFFYIKKALADFVYQLKPLLITQRKSFCNCREATSRSPLRSDRLGGAVRFP